MGVICELGLGPRTSFSVINKFRCFVAATEDQVCIHFNNTWRHCVSWMKKGQSILTQMRRR